ncbi:unnamed protein product [Periconia digitata]|uniref:Uncharacterized protein n=1 Tax=Periconia digitata TaxID=1303443 RepID=A0A9W4XTL1_9PLEO|nr:unnamed protein product [Periconia digitata]
MPPSPPRPSHKYSAVPAGYHSSIDTSSSANLTAPTTKPTKKIMKTKTHSSRRYDMLRNVVPKSSSSSEETVTALPRESIDSRSSTEVEDIENEAGREMRWAKEGRTKQQKQRGIKGWGRKIGKWRWVIDTGLLLVVLGLLLDRRSGGERSWAGGRMGAEAIGGDITGFAPRFSQQIVSFAPNDTFSPEEPLDWWSNKTQQAWLDIVPEGLGYVLVQDPATHANLPSPIHDYPNQAVYTTSLTHQMHCLYTVMEAYNTLQLSLSTTMPPSTASSHSSFTTDDAELKVKMPWHVTHCFEYLRQSIMCAGDVALEGAATTFPKGKGGVDLGGSDGWDAKHVCRNYDEVKGYLEDKAVWRKKWIKSEDTEIEGE